MNRKMMARILNADRDYAWLSNAYIADADDGVRVCVVFTMTCVSSVL